MDIPNDQEEKNMNLLFQDLLDEIIERYGVTEPDIEEALADMTRNFRFDRGRLLFPDIITWNNMCGYIFRFASHGAGLTRHRVLEAVRNSEALASSLRSRQLNIISLGGGPGSDIVGLGSALFECGVRDQHLNITVVDLHEIWSVCVNHVIQLARERHFGNFSQLLRLNHVQTSFLQVGLPGNPEENETYFDRLQRADVILMVKLISIMGMNTVESLIESLLQNMKDEAIILLIDSPRMSQYSYVTGHFEILFQSYGNEYSSPYFNRRFNFTDQLSTTAQIAVLRKKITL